MTRLRSNSLPIGKRFKVAASYGIDAPSKAIDNAEKLKTLANGQVIELQRCEVESKAKMVMKQGSDDLKKKSGSKCKALKMFMKKVDKSIYRDEINASLMEVDVKSTTRKDEPMEESDKMTSLPLSTNDSRVRSCIYMDEIYMYLQERETRCCQPANFLENGDSAVNSYSRSILMDWLIKVQSHLDLLDQTLFLAMTLVDKFLTVSSLSLDKLQLLGITCLLITSKVEERYPPEILMLCYLTDNTYSKADVLRMERIVLRMLNFDISLPTSVNFFDIMTYAQDVDLQVANLGRYLMHLGLSTTLLLRFAPSLRAAAALNLAREIILSCDDSYTSTPPGYIAVEIMQCMQIYARLLLDAPNSNLQAARTKYSSRSQYGGLAHHSLLIESPALAAFAFNNA